MCAFRPSGRYRWRSDNEPLITFSPPVHECWCSSSTGWSLVVCLVSPLFYRAPAFSGERITLYWPCLNAAPMKARADNSFFITSLASARLGISFSVAAAEKFRESPPLHRSSICVFWNIIFLILRFCSIKLCASTAAVMDFIHRLQKKKEKRCSLWRDIKLKQLLPITFHLETHEALRVWRCYFMKHFL